MSLTKRHCEELADIYNKVQDRLQFIAPHTTRPICDELYELLYNFLSFECENFNSEKFYKATHKRIL